MPSSAYDRRDLGFAAAALAFYAIHAGQQVWHGRGEDALWLCHLANLVLAVGFLFSSQRALGAALMWLALGNVLWVGYLVQGGEFVPTSILTHLGGLVLAASACLRHGIPAGTWSVASVGLLVMQALARLCTPPEANVNVAWHSYPTWFSIYPMYLAVVDGAAAAVFWMMERAANCGAMLNAGGRLPHCHGRTPPQARH